MSFKAFREETYYVCKHYDQVLKARETLDAAEEDLADFLRSLGEELRRRSWWAAGKWQVKFHEGEALWIWKTDWEKVRIPGQPITMGIIELGVLALTEASSSSQSLIEVPEALVTTEFLDRLEQAARKIDGIPFTGESGGILGRRVPCHDLGLDAAKIGERILSEFDALASLSPVIDELVQAAGEVTE